QIWNLIPRQTAGNRPKLSAEVPRGAQLRNSDAFDGTGAGLCRPGRCASVVAAALAVALSMAPSGASAQTVLPDINVIAPAPLPAKRGKPRPAASRRKTDAAPAPAAPVATSPPPAGAIDRDKVPANTQVLTAADLDHSRSATMIDALVRALPGASVSDQNGNPFQRDLNY